MFFNSLLTLACVYLIIPQDNAVGLYLPVIGATAGFVHFLYSQHHFNTDIFLNLFKEFNTRYDMLNNKINAIYHKESTGLTLKEKCILYDYFNLCGEEYLFYKSGYIDCDVWASWLAGMKHYATNPDIRALWEVELNSESYYGFDASLIRLNEIKSK